MPSRLAAKPRAAGSGRGYLPPGQRFAALTLSHEPETAAETIAAWRESVRMFEPRTATGSKLRTAALAFLDSELAAQAAGLGWISLELFGVSAINDAEVVSRRPDGKGAVSFVALAPWHGTRLQSLTAAHAIIIAGGSGGILRQPKRTPANSVPFWKSGAL